MGNLYTRDFRMKVLGMLASNPEFSDEFLPFVDDTYFPEPDLRIILKSISNIRASGAAYEITKSVLGAEIMDLSKLRSFDYEIGLRSIAEMYDLRNGDDSTIKSKLVTWIKTERLKLAMAESIEVLKTGGELGQIQSKIDDALSVGIGASEGITIKDSGFIERYRKTYSPDNLISTGFKSYDALFMGGYAPGELHVMMGPPKTGKTTFAVNVGAHVIASNKGAVIHITEEISEDDVLAKYVLKFTGMCYDDLLTMSDEVYRARTARFDRLQSNLFIKFFVNKSVDSNGIKSYIASLRSKGKISKIALIIIDYDDLTLPVKGDGESMYEDGGNIYMDFIKLADYFKCPVLTLAQPNRQAWDKATNSGDCVMASDIAHSAKKIMNTWSISSINRFSDTDYQLYVDLVRRGIGHTRIPMNVDLNRASFKEVN